MKKAGEGQGGSDKACDTDKSRVFADGGGGFSVGRGRTGERLFNFRPCFFCAAALAAGIAFSYACLFLPAFAPSAAKTAAAVGVIVVFAVGLAVALFFSGKRRGTFVFSLAIAFAFSAGAISFSARIDGFEKSAEKFPAGEYTVVATVDSIVSYGGYGRVYFVCPTADGRTGKGKMTAVLSAAQLKNLRLSDEVLMTGRVEPFSPGTDGEFSASRIADGVCWSIFADTLTVTGRNPDLFRTLRERLRNALFLGMDEEPAAVVYALLIGDASAIDAGLMTGIRRGGIAHVFAVSGLHLGALYAALGFLLKKTFLGRLPKGVKFALVATVLLFYGGICGYSASVVRATAMCLTFYAAGLLGVKSDALENIGIAAAVVLSISPVSLFEVGFRLSFAACLSIALLARPFRAAAEKGIARLCPRGRFAAAVSLRASESPKGFSARFLSGALTFLCVTLSAQAGTAPVLLDAFGYLSVWGLLLNCLFVPLIGGVFGGVLALAVLSAFFPAAASVFLYAPSAALSALLLIFHAFDFSFVLEGFSFGVSSLPWYALLVLLSDKINLRGKGKAVSAGLFLFAFLFCLVAVNV